MAIRCGTVDVTHSLPATEDLVETQVAANPDPLWETVLSLQILLNGDGRLVFRKWCQRTRGRIPEIVVEQFLLPLSSPLGPFADFLTPAASALGLEAGLDSVLSTPRGSIRKDVAVLSGARHLPSWTGALADADVGTLRLVTSAMRSWHETAVVPYRAQIRAHVDAETAAHARLLRHGGIERVLQSLPAPLRWQAPVRTA